MPYINSDARQEIDCNYAVDSIYKISSGELNYLITRLLLEQDPKRYEDFNRLIGVLECCKLEFYRRAVAAYEDEKIKENGDVY